MARSNGDTCSVTTQIQKVAAFRSERTVVTVLDRAARYKVFQVFFGRDGSVFVTFPYFGHRTGILAAATIPGNGQTTSQVNLQVGGKIASHLVKYSHHSDGRAHFSQDGKVRTEIKRQSVALSTQHGHIFSLLVQGLQAFDKADEKKDVGSSSKRTALTFQITETEAVKFVGRWLDVSMISMVGPSSTIGPTLLTQDSAGNQRSGVLLASPYDEEPHHVLCITSEPITRLGPEPEIMCFYGGFATREVMDDTTQEAGFLAFIYPASDADELKQRLGTIDR